jgi:glycosyltransferase 2 family protein
VGPGSVADAAKSVLWERVLGQLATIAVMAVVLALFPVAGVPRLLVLVVGVAAGAGLALGSIRFGRLSGRILIASTVASAGYVLMFLVAAELVPLALIVLLASAVPLSIAGWGPREGAAAWAFAAAGLGASTGFAVSTAYGVMALVSTLPGAWPLLRPATFRVQRRVP